MAEQKISPGLVIVGGLGLGLVAAGVFALAMAARGLGFSLRIIIAPPGAVLWNANFAERTWDYDPIADSGWLSIDESWDFPSDPLGCTTLRIWALDAEDNILFDVRNLGPIEGGKSYVFDYITGELSEV